MAKMQTPTDSLKGLAQGDPDVVEQLTKMTAGTLERSGLDDQTFMLVRIAALVASDAAPVSYLANLAVSAEAGLDLKEDPRNDGRGRARRRHRAHHLSRIEDGSRRRTGNRAGRLGRRRSLDRRCTVASTRATVARGTRRNRRAGPGTEPPQVAKTRPVCYAHTASWITARGEHEMKIVVVGGSGLIGTKVVNGLRGRGHEVMSASLQSGVNTITGDGLAPALADAQVVIDVTNAPSFEDAAVMDFFTTSTRNLLAAEADAGVSASRCALHRRDRPTARQRLLPREGRPGAVDRRSPRLRTRSSGRRSSSSSSTASPTKPPTATPSTWHPYSSNPSRPTTSPRPCARSPSSRRSTERSRWPGPSSSDSTNSSDRSSAAATTRARSSATPTRCSSAPNWTSEASSPTAATPVPPRPASRNGNGTGPVSAYAGEAISSLPHTRSARRPRRYPDARSSGRATSRPR